MTAKSFDDIAGVEDQFQLATYKKMPIAAERGEGVWIYTSEGDRYLDLYGGHAVAGTGHCHPHVVNALKNKRTNCCSIPISFIRKFARVPPKNSRRSLLPQLTEDFLL